MKGRAGLILDLAQEGDAYPEWPEDAEVPPGQREVDFRLAAAEAIRARGNALFKAVRAALSAHAGGAPAGAAQRPASPRLPRGGCRPRARALGGRSTRAPRARAPAAWAGARVPGRVPAAMALKRRAAPLRRRAAPRRASTRRRCSATTRRCTGWTRTHSRARAARPAPRTCSAWAARSSRRV